MKQDVADLAESATLAFWIGIVLMVCTIPIPVKAAERLPNNVELLVSLEEGVKGCPAVSQSTGVYRLRDTLKNLKEAANEDLRKEHEKALVACRTRKALFNLLKHCPVVADSPTALLVRAHLDEVHYGTVRWSELTKNVDVVSRVCFKEFKFRMQVLQGRMEALEAGLR